MAGVFVVIVPTEEHEIKCREKEEASSKARTGSNDRLALIGKAPGVISATPLAVTAPLAVAEATATPEHRLHQNGGTTTTTTASNGGPAGRPNIRPQRSSASSMEGRTSMVSSLVERLLHKVLEDCILTLRVHDAVWHSTKDSKYFQMRLRTRWRESIYIVQYTTTSSCNAEYPVAGDRTCSSDRRIDGSGPCESSSTSHTSRDRIAKTVFVDPASVKRALPWFYFLRPFSQLPDRLSGSGYPVVVHRASWQHTSVRVVFTCESQERCEEILQTLYRAGIGRLYESTLCVIPCSLYYEAHGGGDKDNSKDNGHFGSDTESEAGEDDELHPKNDLKSLRKQFIQSIKARLTVAQVVEGVKAGAKLTFDYIMFVMLASLIAALGLVENSPVIVVASMLISPIMGPIMAWTFGTVIKDQMLQRIGIKSELIGLAVCIMTGFVFGLICGPLDKVWGSGQLPTTEMLSRGKLRGLWVGMLIALPSGAGVALSILGGNAGSLVGVAISASLLPPCVNAGILWAYALVIYLRSFTESVVVIDYHGVELTNPPSLLPSLDDDKHLVEYSYNMVYESLLLGVMSMLLCFVNIICIVFMAIVVLKIKEVAPYTSIPTTARFWKEDIKITRDYNKTVQGNEAKRFGQSFLEEWAALNNMDPATTTPQTASQLNNYLRNVVEEAGEDDVYRTVIRYMGSNSPVDPVTATLGSLNRTTWPHPSFERGSMKKPKVWDIDFNPRGASTRRRMFSDPSEKYTQLHTISETDVDSPENDTEPISPHRPTPKATKGGGGAGGGEGSAATTPTASGAGPSTPTSSSAFHAPSRLLRSLIGSKRFVVTRADMDHNKSHRKSKKQQSQPPSEDMGV